MGTNPTGNDPTLPSGDGAMGTARTVAPGASANQTVTDTLPAPSASGGTARDVASAMPDFAGLTPSDRANYAFGREVARGGMGRITTARDRRLARSVAIKELLVDAGDLRARFEREARITAKLQHPSIVQIHEAGVWASGEPYYVMQLVAGKSLDRALAEHASLAGRLGLLPNVIAVADALAYAHSQRVIHRDLKPANVLVGEFGETVVIDWGLAKDLGDTREYAPSVTPVRTASADETEVGAIMGTPAFMPPEQARGDVVDERADVYALGAMLYYLLAGEPPYTGKTSAAVLDAVLHGSPPSLATRVPDAPKDLLAIVDKALARDAADRYPTAQALATDLRRFQTGQLVGVRQYTAWQLLGRWIRKHRAAVAVGSAAFVVLAVFGVIAIRRILAEQHATAAQRTVATTNRGQAEDLIGFMLDDLRKRLEPLGKLDVLDTVAAKATSYYAARGPISDSQEWSNRARLGLFSADLERDHGKLEQAISGYRAALSAFLAVSVVQPTPEVLGAIAETRERLGNALSAQGDRAGALSQLLTALQVREQVVALAPDSEAAPGALAAAYSKLGMVLRSRGDAAGAYARFRTALALTTAWVEKKPDDPDRLNNLFVVQTALGDATYERGDTAGSLAMYEQALASIRRVASKRPDAKADRGIMIALSNVASLRQETGALDAALAQLREAISIAERLASADPTNMDRKRDVGVNLLALGRLQVRRSDDAASVEALRSATELFERLVASSPNNIPWLLDLADCRIEYAEALGHRGDRVEAKRQLGEGTVIRERLAHDEPANDYYQSLLGDVYRSRGAHALDAKQWTEALVELRRSAALDAQRLEAAPHDPGLRSGLGRTRMMIGLALLPEKHAREALVEFEAARVAYEGLVADDPTNALVEHDLIAALANIGDAKLAMRDRAGARQAYRGAQVRLEAIAARGQSTPWTTNEAKGIAMKLVRAK